MSSKSTPPKGRAVQVVIPTGFGINCEAETAFAFQRVGATVQAVHLNDLIHSSLLAKAHILALAGGFSFGDHLGAGKALANRLGRGLGPQLERFIKDGGLVLGICNGFQTMVRLGLVPSGQLHGQNVALTHNHHGRFYDGWVTLLVDPQSPCVFTRGIRMLDVPVRHGEGQLVAPAPVLEQILQQHLAPLRYGDPATAQPTHDFPLNPNGSVDCIAGLCDASGRIFGLMPHPEAFLYPENHPDWRHRPRPKQGEGDGLQIFRNAVEAAAG
jgi:phosphoribosylformylglycinamidine synthase